MAVPSGGVTKASVDGVGTKYDGEPIQDGILDSGARPPQVMCTVRGSGSQPGYQGISTKPISGRITSWLTMGDLCHRAADRPRRGLIRLRSAEIISPNCNGGPAPTTHRHRRPPADASPDRVKRDPVSTRDHQTGTEPPPTTAGAHKKPRAPGEGGLGCGHALPRVQQRRYNFLGADRTRGVRCVLPQILSGSAEPCTLPSRRRRLRGPRG